jgi:hypothetical protein
VINADPRHSDHRPVIVECGEREEAWRRVPREVCLKFEAKWLEEDCQGRVEQAWVESLEAGARDVVELQKKVLQELHDWDKNVLGQLEKRISKVKKELENCRRGPVTQENVSREHLLRYKMERLQEQLNVYWKQRSHTSWLTKGDRDTKFFHAAASERKRRNVIKKVEKRRWRGGGERWAEGLYC